MLVKSSDTRLKSVYVRAEKLGYTKEVATEILEMIGSFKNVENFMSWKNSLSDEMKFMVERVGPNNYRKMRDMVAGL